MGKYGWAEGRREDFFNIPNQSQPIPPDQPPLGGVSEGLLVEDACCAQGKPQKSIYSFFGEGAWVILIFLYVFIFWGVGAVPTKEKKRKEDIHTKMKRGKIKWIFPGAWVILDFSRKDAVI